MSLSLKSVSKQIRNLLCSVNFLSFEVVFYLCSPQSDLAWNLAAMIGLEVKILKKYGKHIFKTL